MKTQTPEIPKTVLLRAVILFIANSILAAPAGPVPQVPEGGAAPGAFPNTSVTGVNVIARGSTTFNGSVDVVGLEGQGPIPWSVNRFNRGDFALRLSPANPTAALSILGQGFSEFGDSTPGVAASHAWRPTPALGVVMASARRNGPIDWNDGEGAFYPTVAISPASSGPGYNMVDGSFSGGNLDINTGRARKRTSSLVRRGSPMTRAGSVAKPPGPRRKAERHGPVRPITPRVCRRASSSGSTIRRPAGRLAGWRR